MSKDNLKFFTECVGKERKYVYIIEVLLANI